MGLFLCCRLFLLEVIGDRKRRKKEKVVTIESYCRLESQAKEENGHQ
jgi:hypothetical protein